MLVERLTYKVATQGQLNQQSRSLFALARAADGWCGLYSRLHSDRQGSRPRGFWRAASWPGGGCHASFSRVSPSSDGDGAR